MYTDINKLTHLVIHAAIKVHSKIGPGCFEKVYEEALNYELDKVGLFVQRQLLLSLQYEELYLKDAYKIDLLVERQLVVEIKSVFPLAPVYFNQVQTQLHLLNLKNGLLLNFKVPILKQGIHRVFNNKGAASL
jgi:GxxExxY protein